MKSNATIEGYNNYYASIEFQKDLMSWFKVGMSSTSPHFPLIKHADRNFNSCRVSSMPSQTREKSFYFSFCVFLHAIQPQAIYKLSGEEMMYKFHAETGVPLVSCGLGGIMHPSHMLVEANLHPEGEEIPAYIEMIDTIMPAVRAQIEELADYAPIDDLYSIIKEEIMAFRDRLQRRVNHPSYFIECW